jgi:hypothetical protein
MSASFQRVGDDSLRKAGCYGQSSESPFSVGRPADEAESVGLIESRQVLDRALGKGVRDGIESVRYASRSKTCATAQFAGRMSLKGPGRPTW